MPPPLTDVRQISKVAYGFFASKALFAALNLGLFGHLAAGAQRLDGLATATGVPRHRLATLLATLASVGLVSHGDDDTWANAPAAARYLVPGEPAYFGDYYRFQIDRQLYPNMMALDAAMAGDEAGLAHRSMSGLFADPVEAEAFSRAQHAGSLGPAMLLAKAIDVSQAATLLDVAGGTGAFAITLCRRHPALRATIVDFPNVVAVAARYIGEAGLGDRIALLPGDALDADWPAGQAVVLMSYLLSAVGAADIPVLLRRARAALAPGGRIVVHDFMLDEDRAGPFAAAGFFLQYLTLRTDPVSFTASEVAAWLADAGFENVESAILIPEITRYAVARAPEWGSTAIFGATIGLPRLLHRLPRIGRPPQIPGGDAAIRRPDFAERRHFAGFRLRLQLVQQPIALAHAEIVDRQDIFPAEREDQQHFDGPAADAADHRQPLDQLRVAEARGGAAGRHHALRRLRGDVADRGGFSRGEAAGAHRRVVGGQHLLWGRERHLRIQRGEPAEDRTRGVAVQLLVGDRGDQRLIRVAVPLVPQLAWPDAPYVGREDRAGRAEMGGGGAHGSIISFDRDRRHPDRAAGRRDQPAALPRPPSPRAQTSLRRCLRTRGRRHHIGAEPGAAMPRIVHLIFTGDDADRDEADRQTASLAGLAVTLLLVVVGLFLIHQLRHKGLIEDCLLAGGRNCDAVLVGTP
jgi:ubiquinone/menaquinone biosynthesis C-methylase UbiE